MTWTDHQYNPGLTWGLCPSPPFKEHDPISNANILQWRITSFLEWRKPTRINQISNTPCGFFSNLAFAGMRNQSKQSSHSPWPSPTSYIPSGQAAPSSAPLVQPDNFRQVTLPFPLLSQSPAFSLAFQTTQKLPPTLPVVSFSSLEYTKSFHGTLPPWHDTL